jgi:hypothetical protein
MTLKNYELYTLVDITDTGDTNPRGNTKEYKQNQNLKTILQSLSMRSQVFVDSVTFHTESNKKLDFGDVFKGKLKYWKLNFRSDIEEPWRNGDDIFFYAKSDLNGAPIYDNLDEDIFVGGMISCHGETKNTYIKNLLKT